MSLLRKIKRLTPWGILDLKRQRDSLANELNELKQTGQAMQGERGGLKKALDQTVLENETLKTQLKAILVPPYTDTDAQLILEHLKGQEQLAEFIDFIIQNLLSRDHNRLFLGDRLLSLDKSAGFFDDPVFTESYERIRGAHIYDDHQTEHTIAWRLHVLVWAARQAFTLPEGDLLNVERFKETWLHLSMKWWGFGQRAKLFSVRFI